MQVTLGPSVRRIYKDDKLTYVKDLSGKLSRSTSKNLSDRLSVFQDKTVLLTSYRESLGKIPSLKTDPASVLFSQEKDFLALGLLGLEDTGATNFLWTLRNVNVPAVASWPADFEKALFKQINWANASAVGRFLQPVEGLGKTTYFVFGLRVEIGQPQPTRKTWALAVLPSSCLDDIITDYSTGIYKFVILDKSGLALASSDPSYRLKNLKDDDFFSPILQDTSASRLGELSLQGEMTVVDLEPINKTNLISILITPEKQAFDSLGALRRSLVIYGIVYVLCALGLSILFANWISKNSLPKTTLPDAPKRPDPLPKFESEPKDVQVTVDKNAIFRQVSQGLVKEIKNPMAGVLGHLQIALAKTESPEIQKHLNFVENEIRRCKNIVDQLSKVGETALPATKLANLAQIALDALNLMDHSLSLAGCKIFKDFRPCPMVMADAKQLEQVIVSLLKNAGEAVETSTEKGITVRVMEVGGRAQIQIEDTGVGISEEQAKTIFEPFSALRPRGLGLSLAAAKSLMSSHRGEILIKKPISGMGTTVTLDFPIPEKRVKPDKPLSNLYGTVEENPAPKVEATPKLFPVAPTVPQGGPPGMPPVPEEAEFLEKIRPTVVPTVPPPAATMAVQVTSSPPQAAAGAVKAEPPFAVSPPRIMVERAELRTARDFKVKIRRPKLRT